MKRVLIITYYWPPTGGSGVQRWVKFAKYLPQEGWQPVIYTPENPDRPAVDESLMKDIPEGVEVISTPIREPYALYRKYNGAKKEVNPLNAGTKSFKQKLFVWVRGNFFIPDPRVSWVRPSVRFLCKYLEEHPVDVIVTTGPPQSMHLIGRDLKKRTGIKWIADFRDPWTEMFYFKHMGLWPLAEKKHRRLEQDVLDSADGIISVSPPVAEDFRKKTRTPVYLVTNGFDEDDFPVTGTVTADGTFSIVHTGLFAADGNPLKLWDALAAKCSQDAMFRQALRIRLAGRTDLEIIEAIRQRGLDGNLEELGYLPHDATVRLQRQADMLILPLRMEPEYAKVLPGKIFEYLASRRPVLGIGQEDGAAAAILRDSGAGMMYDWENKQSISDFVDLEWRRFISGEPGGNMSDISGYTRRVLAVRLAGILEEFTGRSTSGMSNY